jgi:hypothetical protein
MIRGSEAPRAHSQVEALQVSFARSSDQLAQDIGCMVQSA